MRRVKWSGQFVKSICRWANLFPWPWVEFHLCCPPLPPGLVRGVTARCWAGSCPELFPCVLCQPCWVSWPSQGEVFSVIIASEFTCAVYCSDGGTQRAAGCVSDAARRALCWSWTLSHCLPRGHWTQGGASPCPGQPTLWHSSPCWELEPKPLCCCGARAGDTCAIITPCRVSF